MMKQYLRGICVLLCVFMAHTGFSAEAPKELLIVRPEGSWPPQEMVVDGEIKGIHIDLVREVAKKLNLPITIKTYPWKRAIKMLEDGKADAATYMSKTDEREKFGYYFEGNILSSGPIGFFILKEFKDEIKYSGDLKSLQSYTIGTCRGYAYQEEFDKATYLKKDDGAADDESLLKKVISKRVKIAAGYVNDIKYQAKQMGVADKIEFLRPLLMEGKAVYIVFSKPRNHHDLGKRFADAMEAFKATAQYDDLLKKYGLEKE